MLVCGLEYLCIVGITMAKMNDDVDKENDPSSSSLLGKSLPNLESGTKAESNVSLSPFLSLLCNPICKKSPFLSAPRMH